MSRNVIGSVHLTGDGSKQIDSARLTDCVIPAHDRAQNAVFCGGDLWAGQPEHLMPCVEKVADYR